MAGKVEMRIYSCMLRDGAFCAKLGKLPSKADEFKEIDKRFCHQSASINRTDIVCDKAKITHTDIQANVTESGKLY